jgi:N-acetylglucosaminyldiphosphoundecaprenol N-acetyl-beta-D-mannosaminyltransferase
VNAHLQALPTKRAHIAGVDFSFVVQDAVLDRILRWRRADQRKYIVLSNPHSVMMCNRDENMERATAGAELTLPDGIGIVLAAKILGLGKRYRVTGPSLMLRMCNLGRRHGLRHFFYGGAPGVAKKLAEKLAEQFPGLIVAGHYTPPFHEMSPAEDQQAVDAINASNADIVWVGLGAPKQEKWMADHVGKINSAALVGVGAAFNFHAGTVPWAPKFFRRWGLEWAYRLATEPRRMWRRNLDSPLFLASAISQSFTHKATSLANRLALPEEPMPTAMPLRRNQAA